MVDTEDFKASEYFDILQNSWPTAGLSDAIDKASMKCKSMAFSILSQRTYTFPIINMINPVEGIMIKSFSKTPSENDGVDIKVAKGTKVKAAGLPSEIGEYIMGHKTKGSSKVHQEYGTGMPPQLMVNHMKAITVVQEHGYFEQYD